MQKLLAIWYNIYYFSWFQPKLGKMAKQKNKSKGCQANPTITVLSACEASLSEKQAVSNFDFQTTATRITQKKASAGEKGEIVKRRGRVQQKKWSSCETVKLYQLHDQLGNKWKEIAKYFPDRSDNNIKNHFFSRLRLSLRRLNKVISKLLGFKKQIKNHTLYKINSICELKFKDNSQESQSLMLQALNLKKRILSFSQISPEDEVAMELWKNISIFSSKITHNRMKIEQTSQLQDQVQKVGVLVSQELQQGSNNKDEVQQMVEVKKRDENALRTIQEDDFVIMRTLTPNERLLLAVPPQLQTEKAEEYVEKPAITVPENLFLSPTHSIEDSAFNLNISDQSYFSQNQNISFYTDFLNEKRPQNYGTQKNTL